MPEYIVVSDAGAQRLAAPDRQKKRYRQVLYTGAAATVFTDRRKAERAVERTIAYRAEIYGARPDRDRKQYWIIRLGDLFGDALPAVPPRRRAQKKVRPHLRLAS